MDANNAPSRRATRATPANTPPQGGTVEPANRATVAIERFQTPPEPPAERFELRDPFADVTYRSDRFTDMVAKADRLGASRFVALDAQGQRSWVHKVDGQWLRDDPRLPQRAATPERPVKDATEQDRSVPSSNVIPLTTTPMPQPPPRSPEVADAQASAKIDAQAERAALVARLEAALIDRYLIKRAPVTVGDLTIGLTEYRFRGDTSRVAFTESTFRLATDTNSPSVARSMVDVAEARNWQSLRISGNEDFKRLVWLEAAARGVKTLGYEPNPADLERLKVERELRQVNRIEPARDAITGKETASTATPTGRGSGGRKAVLAAIDAILLAKRVPEKHRIAIMAAATEKLAQRMRDGQVPKVKVYDTNAPSRRPAVITPREVQRTRERAAPVR
ncbi:MAG: LPD7 domain-containing protein [Hydrogenophaga sp.]|uniref:LPD7 domain-containing protein n=1 Tax=Hydrogenophaga sp. TaxID=1904254 RepID=UPI00276A70CD|nr:LPD7 domain-containing protein [Hydrogenophaga sp.]MDP2263740.1 LPD7 domain-containing protein [Hydrogenophaga sp.]MDZ4283857.1 LPD7 domain-containing protein [Hydrogenophaga sp.]